MTTASARSPGRARELARLVVERDAPVAFEREQDGALNADLLRVGGRQPVEDVLGIGAERAKTGSPAVPVGRVRRLRRPTHRFSADTVLDGGLFSPDERSSALVTRSACYQAGCARATLTAIQRSGAGQSRAARQGRAQASRAAAPLDGPEKRSYDVPFEHRPRQALQSRNASNYGLPGCVTGVHRPTGTAGAPSRQFRHLQRTTHRRSRHPHDIRTTTRDLPHPTRTTPTRRHAPTDRRRKAQLVRDQRASRSTVARRGASQRPSGCSGTP